MLSWLQVSIMSKAFIGLFLPFKTHSLSVLGGHLFHCIKLLFSFLLVINNILVAYHYQLESDYSLYFLCAPHCIPQLFHISEFPQNEHAHSSKMNVINNLPKKVVCLFIIPETGNMVVVELHQDGLESDCMSVSLPRSLEHFIFEICKKSKCWNHYISVKSWKLMICPFLVIVQNDFPHNV